MSPRAPPSARFVVAMADRTVTDIVWWCGAGVQVLYGHQHNRTDLGGLHQQAWSTWMTMGAVTVPPLCWSETRKYLSCAGPWVGGRDGRQTLPSVVKGCHAQVAAPSNLSERVCDSVLTC